MFNWIRVRGVTTTTGGDGDGEHASHNIRVFAQVEGLDKQAIATQGDVSTGFSTREDACASGECAPTGGCLAACERATSSALADDALEKCRGACSDACTKPDASGKFSCVVYPDDLTNPSRGTAGVGTGVGKTTAGTLVGETGTAGTGTGSRRSVDVELVKNAAGGVGGAPAAKGGGSGGSMGRVDSASSQIRRPPPPRTRD